eukprot:gene26423-35074_t
MLLQTTDIRFLTLWIVSAFCEISKYHEPKAGGKRRRPNRPAPVTEDSLAHINLNNNNSVHHDNQFQGLLPSNQRSSPSSTATSHLNVQSFGTTMSRGFAGFFDRPQRIVKIGREQEFSFCDNFVKTSKYEVWNFLPKFLMEEFNPKTKIANCYFLLISGLQCIGPISNTGGIPTTLLPLSIVVIIDALFQVFEDIARHRAFPKPPTASNHVHGSRGQIPADVVIFAVNEEFPDAPQGICYVETKSLDGETNLKIRNALPNTYAKIREPGQLSELVGQVEMEHPNKLIDAFTGVVDLTKCKLGREPINPNSVLLRGCVLRNTEWAFGLVVNSGHDTKIMIGTLTQFPSGLWTFSTSFCCMRLSFRCRSMYYSPTDTPALVRTMTLNEELGQISHIFSDKTGTLTCNIMDFRKATINGVCYGEGITEIGRAAWKLQGRPIPQVRLSASNPDDEALVCAAGYFGFEFADKRDGSINYCITLLIPVMNILYYNQPFYSFRGY